MFNVNQGCLRACQDDDKGLALQLKREEARLGIEDVSRNRDNSYKDKDNKDKEDKDNANISNANTLA